MKLIFSVKNDLFPLMRLAIPLALTGIVQSSVYFFETLFLARLGEEYLAAGALVSWLFGTLAVILFGVLTSVNVLVAHKHGANNETGISYVIRDGLFLSVLLSFPAFFLFWHMSPIFLLFGQTPEVVLLSKDYLQALAWGLLPDFILVALLEFIIGIGQARVVMFFSCLTVVFCIFFSYVLIFGKLGFPSLRIAGAGWGMTISYWITAISLIFYLLIQKSYRTYLKNIFNFGKQSFLWELIKIGFPMGVMYSFEVAYFFALTLFMGSMSSILVAANQIALQYLGLLMSMMFAIAQAITVRMGHLLGAHDYQGAAKVSYMGVSLSAIFMCLIAVIYWSVPELLISVDLDVNLSENSLIVKYATQFLAIGAVFQIFEAMRISLFGSLRALKDTQFTLLTSILSFWVIALPFGYILSLYLEGAGFWWALVFSAIVSVILLLVRFDRKIRRSYAKRI